MRHTMNVLVHMRKWKDGGIPSVKATLVKHPQLATPRSIILRVDRNGVDLLGRITPSFRQLYEEEIARLQSGQGYRNSLIDLAHREALESLISEAWGPEHAAMANSNLPTLMDAMNLTANVHNRKLLKLLERKIVHLQQEVEKLRQSCSEKKTTERSEASGR